MRAPNFSSATSLLAVLALAAAGAAVVPAQAAPSAPAAPSAAAAPVAKTPISVGYGGGVSSVDATATRVGLQVLKRGGNAVDAAVATAAALGVTEPYSTGIGGGGYFVFYNARKGKVQTIDGRETAPAGMTPDAFIDPATGLPYPFSQLVTSGLSVGVPGTPATWDKALKRWGTWSLGRTLGPAIKVADRGFVVDSTFALQTTENQDRFAAFPSTSEIYLPGGQPPAVGSRLQNPDLADTYRLLARKGTRPFYAGRLARKIAATVQDPPVSPTSTRTVMPGTMTLADLQAYRALNRQPTRVGYRGYRVFGMAPSSSGGSTVGEALNILERFDVASMSDADALHHYLEASALAFVDRGAYVGDPAYVDVPLAGLLDDTYAAERACEISETTALPKPLGQPGDPFSYDGVCPTASQGEAADDGDTENISTSNLTVADRWGNVVEYTLTIEQTGGSGIVVPGRGFILNNELTDFSATPVDGDPNLIEPGKRPRSSMSPTIVLRNRKPWLALGSPGGSTIITTVLQILLNRIDRGMTIENALAAPRAAQRNTANVTAEQAFIDAYGELLAPYGHTFAVPGVPGSSAAEIGAATAIELGPGGLMTVVAEPRRRGGGATGVVRPR